MFPDFLCIGAQKAGTTWLDRNLRAHPQVWLPPIKELHYFDVRMGDPRHVVPFLMQKFFGDRPEDARWRRQVRARALRHRRKFRLQNVLWEVNYYFRPPGDGWYASLFEPGRTKITGDITPGYAILRPYMISRVHRLMPEAKIIYMMRNLIERAWSHAMMSFDKGERGRTDPGRDEDVLAEFRRRDSRLQTDYLGVLENWGEYYPPERIFVGFLEDVHFHPERLMREVYAFLGVDPDAGYRVRKEKIHTRSSEAMPTRMAVHLAKTYRGLIERLDERFGGYASFWRYCAERLIESPPEGETITYPLYESVLWEEWPGKNAFQSGTLSGVSRQRHG